MFENLVSYHINTTSKIVKNPILTFIALFFFIAGGTISAQVPYANLGFNDFLRNLTPGVLMVQVALTLYVLWVFRSSYYGDSCTDSESLLTLLREHARIT